MILAETVIIPELSYTSLRSLTSYMVSDLCLIVFYI